MYLHEASSRSQSSTPFALTLILAELERLEAAKFSPLIHKSYNNYQKMDYLGYNQYFEAHFEQEEECVQMQDCSISQKYLQFEIMPDLDDSPFDEKKKEESTLEVTQDLESNDKNSCSEECGSVEPAQLKCQIEFQQKIVDKYRQVFKGTKDDTVELNTNFKTLLVHYFRELKVLNQLNQYEINHLNQFTQRVPSFNSLTIFFQNTVANAGIREKGLELFSSRECIRRILAGRSNMKNKLQMVKFIEKMRLNILAESKTYKWKDVIKKA